jgi:erythromycin esterase
LGVSAWEQAKYWLSLDPTKSYQARDSAMAKVLLELLELDHPTERTVLWAHNFHIRQASLASTSYPPNVACTGTVLRQTLGEDYVAFGLLSTLTLTNWPGSSCGALPNPGPNDLESLLDEVGAPSLLVDLADPELSLIEPGKSYGFGLNAGGDHAVPAEQYRGLVWRAESAAMQSVYGPTSCGP